MKIEKEVWLVECSDGQFFVSEKSHGRYPRIASPVTVTFNVPCPTCGHIDDDDEDMVPVTPAKLREVDEPFEITGPGLYETRKGLRVEIDQPFNHSEFRWSGRLFFGGHAAWKQNGAWSSLTNSHPYDIMRRIS